METYDTDVPQTVYIIYKWVENPHLATPCFTKLLNNFPIYYTLKKARKEFEGEDNVGTFKIVAVLSDKWEELAQLYTSESEILAAPGVIGIYNVQ